MNDLNHLNRLDRLNHNNHLNQVNPLDHQVTNLSGVERVLLAVPAPQGAPYTTNRPVEPLTTWTVQTVCVGVAVQGRW